jgi:hypothetical protein
MNTLLRTRSGAGRKNEAPPRGQIMIMFAVFLTALLGMLGLAMDGGLYLQAKRGAQAAADAGALAGARQMVKWTSSNPTSAHAEVKTFVEGNEVGDLVPSLTYCKYIGDNWNEVGDCTATVPSNASGVRVRTRLEVPMFFMRVVDAVFRDPNKVLWAKGYAKARVMIPTALPPDGPFILCGSAAWGLKDAAGGSLGNPGQSIALLDGSDKIKPQYVGYTFRIHDSQMSNGNSGVRYDAGCKTKSGAGGARWNGLAGGLGAENAGKTAPNWFKYDYGTQAGPVRTAVAGAEGCAAGAASPYNCVMFLPIAKNSPTPRDPREIYVVGFAPFFITKSASNQHDAKLLSDYITDAPSSNGWTRDYAGPVAIKLVW